MHHGEFVALSEARLCVLDAAAFQEAALHFEHLEYDPGCYAKDFVAALNELAEIERTDLGQRNIKASVLQRGYPCQSTEHGFGLAPYARWWLGILPNGCRNLWRMML